MDFYKNIDHFCQNDTGYADRRTARGVHYSVVEDLVVEPVDLEFFKDHARIDFDTDDTLSESYITASRQELEQWGQISFGEKTMRLMALELPDNYRLMFGPVDSIITDGHSNFGDILTEGGTNVDIEFLTKGVINDTIRIAICMLAAARYAIRESIIVNVNGTVQHPDDMIDMAKRSIKQWTNITML